MFCCENADLIRNQREEIILLTGEIKNQEDQLNKLNTANLSLKESVKNLELNKISLEKQVQSLNKEIIVIKGKKNENLTHIFLMDLL